MNILVQPPWYILPVIVLAQFAGTSLWFASNAVMPELSVAFGLGEGAVSDLTSAVQFGFIGGTLVFAVLNLADRFSPSILFLLSALLGATFNALVVWFPLGFTGLLVYRFLTGFFLAGIYPVGMKIASDWFAGQLGKALGLLVGALVLGTALPHLIRSLGAQLDWSLVILAVSGLATFGGLLLYLCIPDGPHRKKGTQFNPGALISVFKEKDFRAATMGYFGHMWELYAFWTFVPILLAHYMESNTTIAFDISFWSFLIIASGFLGCTIGGYVSIKRGSAKVAFFLLSISLVCCLLSVFIYTLPPLLFFIFLLIWGISVVGDSPQFSTLTARTAPKEWVGSALTISTCIGFSITIFSIQILKQTQLNGQVDWALLWLVPGPILGLWATFPLLKKERKS
ncbi:MAG: MFS transporter [Saprospiraceae bacterium]|nr:MFS transporter [Saprospiraceae bacterium]